MIVQRVAPAKIPNLVLCATARTEEHAPTGYLLTLSHASPRPGKKAHAHERTESAVLSLYILCVVGREWYLACHDVVVLRLSSPSIDNKEQMSFQGFDEDTPPRIGVTF